LALEGYSFEIVIFLR